MNCGNCGNEFSKEFDTVQGLNMSSLNELFLLFMIYDKAHCEQIDDITMDFLFGGPTSTNAFMAYNKKL